MRVSVVVPLFNKETTIERALSSIVSQQFEDFEVIVVDDGSTDGSAAAAQRVADSRIRLVRQSNAGPGAARNRGMAEAQGELVAFLDADDEWLPEFLQRAVTRLDQWPRITAVACAWYEEPGGETLLPMWRNRGVCEGLARVDRFTPAPLLVHLVAFMLPCNTVARREILAGYGGFYGAGRCRYAEDAHLWVKVLLNGPVWLDFEPRLRVHREASELSGNLRGMRPIEPFLDDPDDVRRFCPPDLRRLLEEFLAIRAMKTACVLGYWNRWREAARMRRRFAVEGQWRLPWFWPSLVAGSPFGAAAGALGRALWPRLLR